MGGRNPELSISSSGQTLGSGSGIELLPRYVPTKLDAPAARTWEQLVKPSGGRGMERKLTPRTLKNTAQDNPGFEVPKRITKRDLDMGSSSGSLAPPPTARALPPIRGEPEILQASMKGQVAAATQAYDEAAAKAAVLAQRNPRTVPGSDAWAVESARMTSKNPFKEPNPMTKYGSRYQNLPEYKQFLTKQGAGEKIKFLAKRGAFQMAKGVLGGAAIGALGGTVSGTINMKVYHEHEKRTRAILKELDELTSKVKTQELRGTPYSTTHAPPHIPQISETPPQIKKKKNKHVWFDDGPNRFSTASGW